jgi:MFS family permease
MTEPAQSAWESSTAPAERPTAFCWRIVGLLMAYSALSHFNRVSMSVAGTEQIMGQFRWDETKMGVVYSAYLVTYTICMTPGGWLIDRVGAHRALLWMGFGAALFVALTGVTGLGLLTPALVFPALLAIRALAGSVNAPMYPGAARTISFWVPLPKRSLANGLVTGAALIGIAATYTVFGFLMDRLGWPAAFGVTGLATALVAIIWRSSSADQSGAHQGKSVVLPAHGGPLAARTVLDETAILLKSRSLVLLTISYAAVGYFEYMFFYWMQYYFDEVLKLGKTEGRFYATIPTLAMAGGMCLGGWLADRCASQWGDRRGRAIIPVAGMTASAILLGFGILCQNPNWVVTWFALSMAAVGATEGPLWTTAIELGGHRGGTSAAIFNTGGNAGGLVAPVLTPLFSQYFGWQSGLGLASIFCLAGAALWWWIDPTAPSEATEKQAASAEEHT